MKIGKFPEIEESRQGSQSYGFPGGFPKDETIPF
jgi:hypothetical protein